ncbi:MAG: DUF2029 domain-containing protein [Prevotella sp.]|nr:DUF2029 domain-containing protein [Prevotella sp.]MDY3851793.1 glycosyltransferase family 87 protein [Prevotella sp.]
MRNLTSVSKLKTFFAHPFFQDKRTLLGLWLILPVVAAFLKINRNDNNFLIFKGVYWHTIQQLPLYELYPNEYFDHNHYGPVFSLVIAPFALMPHWLGLTLWLVALSLCMFVAVSRSSLSHLQQIFIFWFCAQTLLNSLFMQQFNIAIAGFVIASYFLIKKENDFWAAFLIILGTFVKLYGVVGLAFFFFSRHKMKLIGSLLFWSVVLFVAPMLISSPHYVVEQYGQWFARLLVKNGENIDSYRQNISALGMIRRISGNASYSDLWLLLPAMFIFFMPYLRFKQYRNTGFQMGILASVLLFVVLFSTGSESSSYIIALSGVCFWYLSAPGKRSSFDLGLIIFAFLLSSMGSSDLFPRSFRREVLTKYALKALPCLLIWLKLSYEMMTRDYKTEDR